MSRIYDNTSLNSIPVKTVTVPFTWNPKAFCSGDGVILECCITNIRRFSVVDVMEIKNRYYTLDVKIKRCHKRKYDSSGKEVEPNFSETQKVSTGYLHSSYRTEAKGDSDHLTIPATQKLLSQTQLSSITGSPHEDCVILWIEDTALDKIDLSLGDELRVKTCGNSPFIENITKMEGQSIATCNYAGGEHVGETWTDKILAMKETGNNTSLHGPVKSKDNEGAADDEWDD